MKGDFSRSTFNKIKHYRKVKLQQGRVHVDADWNEQVDIQAYYDQMSMRDIIGSSGAPTDNAGFSINTTGEKNICRIGKGRYYVNGLMVENDDDAEIELPKQQDAKKFIACLKASEQEKNTIDDPDIRESALGGPDTAIRTKVDWQVVFHPISGDADAGEVDVDEEWQKFITSESMRSTGKLAARADSGEDVVNACMLPPGAGYRRLENCFYRIQIVNGGQDGNGATFVWSRENASIQAEVIKIDGKSLTVSSTGRDRHGLAFHEGQWFEITDDRHIRTGTPGTFAKITKVDEKANIIEFDNADGEEEIDDDHFSEKPRIIRWDSDGKIRVPKFSGADDGNGDKGYLQIEDGLEVKFGEGNYVSGNYWQIPARTAKGDIEWPTEDSKPKMLSPEGIVYHYCRLALVEIESDASPKVQDLRRIFPAITELTSMHYVGGDGQRGSAGMLLPAPLMVGVSQGGTPLSGVTVRFEIKKGEGALFRTENDEAEGVVQICNVLTDSNGIAQCLWKLDHVTDNPQVQAAMLDVLGKPAHIPIVFNAAMDRNAPPLGLRVHSGIIQERIATQSYKIVGPYYHDVDDIPESTAPPLITLGRTDIESRNENIVETIRQTEDLAFMSLLNKQYGIPLPDSLDSLAQASNLGLDSFLEKDSESVQVPILFKPVAIDMEKFYVLLLNYNKGPSQIDWTPWTELLGKNVKQISARADVRGRISVFAITADGLECISQTAPNGSWGDWMQLSEQKLRQVVVENNSDGTLHLFGIQSADSKDESDNVLGHMWQDKDGKWSRWSVFDSKIKAKQIAVGSNADGRLVLFGIDLSDIPGYMLQSKNAADMTNWSNWNTMRGIKAKQIAVGSNADGRLEMFATGSRDNTPVPGPIQFQDFGDIVRVLAARPNLGKGFVLDSKAAKALAKNSAARNLKNAKSSSSKSVKTNSANKTIKNTDNSAKLATAIGMSHVLAKHTPAFVVKPAIEDFQKDLVVQIDPKIVIAPSVDDLVFHAWQTSPNGNWSGWSQIGNQRAKQIAVGSNADGRLEVFAAGIDDKLYHIWQTTPNNGWSGWSSLGGRVKDIAVASNADGRIEVFATVPRQNLVLAEGSVLDTKVITAKLQENKKSLDVLSTTQKIQPTAAFSALKSAGILKAGSTSLAVKSDDANKFQELAILTNLKKGIIGDIIASNALYHIWQTTPNNGWSGWSSLGGRVKDIAVASNADGGLSVFSITENNSTVANTEQVRTENEVNLRWWAIPAIDVPTRTSPRPPDDTRLTPDRDSAPEDRPGRPETDSSDARSEKRDSGEEPKVEGGGTDKTSPKTKPAEKPSKPSTVDRPTPQPAIAVRELLTPQPTTVKRPTRVATLTKPEPKTSTRCAEIKKTLGTLEGQLKKLPSNSPKRKTVSTKISALKKERIRLKCPD